MRIAIDIRRAGDYGLGTYIRNIVNQLARLDHNSEYLLIGERRHLEEFDPLPENFSLLEYRHRPGTFRTHLHLPWVLRQRHIDVLHMPWFYAPAMVPARLVITVHDLSDVLAPPAGATSAPPVQTGRLFFARRALLRADHIFAVSQSSKRDLTRAFGIAEEKISVVYNAVDERLLSEPLPAEGERILERHAVTSPFVLYAGNIKPQKNLPRLIEAFAVAKAELRGIPEFAHLKLLVIGEALTRHADLRRAVVRSRVQEDVRFLGFVPRSGAARFLFARARVPVPLAIRRIRPAATRSHGPRHARADVECIVAAGSFRRRGFAGESGKCFRDRARHPANSDGGNPARDAHALRLRMRAALFLGTRGGAGARRLRYRRAAFRNRTDARQLKPDYDCCGLGCITVVVAWVESCAGSQVPDRSRRRSRR